MRTDLTRAGHQARAWYKLPVCFIALVLNSCGRDAGQSVLEKGGATKQNRAAGEIQQIAKQKPIASVTGSWTLQVRLVSGVVGQTGWLTGFIGKLSLTQSGSSIKGTNAWTKQQRRTIIVPEGEMDVGADADAMNRGSFSYEPASPGGSLERADVVGSVDGNGVVFTFKDITPAAAAHERDFTLKGTITDANTISAASGRRHAKQRRERPAVDTGLMKL